MENDNGVAVSDMDSTPDNSNNDPVATNPGDANNPDNSHNDVDNDRSNDGNYTPVATPDDEDDGTLALGNRVWYDGNNNGLIDGNEIGIENVVIEVYPVDGNGNINGPLAGTDTTDANGYWLVDELLSGDYIAIVTTANFAAGAPLADLFKCDYP